jgi:hypothetical protein
MSALRHNPADASLVEVAQSHGCLPPTFTRDSAPTAWSAWERRAVDVIMGAARQADMVPLCLEADRYSGHPVPTRRVYVPLHPDMAALVAGALGALQPC